MCGRFALTATEAEIKSHFGVKVGCVLKARYNISPQSMIPAITFAREITFFRWGFTPAWAKCAEGEWPQQFINARIESILTKPTFKQAFKARRCIVPASGYFEWKVIRGRKQPFYLFSPISPLLGMAGIWETWCTETGETVDTLAILTREANENISHIHERMPVMIPKAFQSQWLDANTKSDVILKTLSESVLPLNYHPVPFAMNNPRFDEKACIESL